jgi:hypothetical protein
MEVNDGNGIPYFGRIDRKSICIIIKVRKSVGNCNVSQTEKRTGERRQQWIRDVNCSISVASSGSTRSAKTWPAKGS